MCCESIINSLTCCSAGSKHEAVLEVKNGQNLSRLRQVYLADKRDNAVGNLPDGIDLDKSPPKLQVAPAQLEGPNQRVPAFWLSGQAGNSIYQGRWIFAAANKLLSMPDFAIVGPPGPVTLTVSGGTGFQGQPLQSGSFQAQLLLGDLATDRLGIANWPSGT